MLDPLRLLLTQLTLAAQICANTERQMSAWGKANGVKGDDIVSLPAWPYRSNSKLVQHHHLSHAVILETDAKTDSFHSTIALPQRPWYQVLPIDRMDHGRAHCKIRHHRGPWQSNLC